MEELLKPVSQTYQGPKDGAEFLTISKPANPTSETRTEFKGASPEEALEFLMNQPDYDTLLAVLKYLQAGARAVQGFNIKAPSPQSAQIVHVLVTEIVPNYWAVLGAATPSHAQSRHVDLLLGCLRSVTGINASLAYMRALLQEATSNPQGLKGSPSSFHLGFMLDMLSRLLRPHDQVKQMWDALSSIDNPAKLRPLRHEFVSVIAGGKIISLSAEAEDVLRQAGKLEKPLWIADSKQYVGWLGSNLVRWASIAETNDTFKLMAQILSRGLKLGHSELLVRMLLTDVLIQGAGQRTAFASLLECLADNEQKKVLFVVLKHLSSQYLGSVDMEKSTEDYPLVWATAGVIGALTEGSEPRRSYLVDWLTGASGAGVGEGCGIRRAVVAVVAGHKESITTVLEKSLNQFGDQLYVRHAPMLQQEAHAQVLLLSAGYVHRTSPLKLAVLLRSGTYQSAISNRLAASQFRAGFLGMVVGEALSGLVHGEEKKLDFHVDETNTEEGKWYKSLVQLSDKVGPISPLRGQTGMETCTKATTTKKSQTKRGSGAPRIPPQPGFIIEEVEDDEEEDDGLTPHAKPDSDAEDSDEDPTLVNRDKPKAPVYVRDLIAYLRDTENYDRQRLALNTAPTLIRRKANYGSEVSLHAEELATLLVGLNDTYELEDFHNLRLQGMVATVVAQPQKMGRWFAKTFFDGDYSLSQRASILIVLGLGGREIAGLDTSEYAPAASFPSKQLPAKVEKHYALASPPDQLTSAAKLKTLPSNALDSIARSLSDTFLAPLAAEAADAATGPDALKISSFTSRLQSSNTSTTANPNPRGVRSIPNTTASLISTNFFFPLTSRFQAARHSASAATRGILFQPSLLALYLKTLALLLHAAGPSTLALPQMTTELWDLLLGVRAQCVGEPGVAQAALFGLMTLLDVNEGNMRALCEQHGREVVESVEWVGDVFDRTRGGDAGGDGEENRVKMMAAGILIRLREAMEKHRALLMGDLIGFT